MEEDDENPLAGFATPIEEAYHGLTMAEKLDMVFRTPEGKQLLEKKNEMGQLDFQVAVLEIMEKYGINNDTS